MPCSSRSQKLLALVDLLNTAAQAILEEWEKEEEQESKQEVPTLELYNAKRTVIATCGAFSELLLHPEHLISEVALGFFQARTLHVAVEHRVADVLATADQNTGMAIEELASRVGVDCDKLARIMRTLCSAHIFSEVVDGRFANNTVSAYLVGNDALQAWVTFHGVPIYAAANELPTVLRDSVRGPSTSPSQTPLAQSVGRDVTLWEWLEEKTIQPDGTLKPNPMMEVAGLAMISVGRTLAAPLTYDFPWASLGDGTVVDVGGGLGGMCLDLARTYPGLNFVNQDRPPVLEKATALWQKEYPEALDSRVTMMPHDFFQTNPVRNAEVYILRHIIHDCNDEDCIRILTGIKVSMAPTSRLLIADQVVNTTVGYPEITPAPAPLPANYGVWNRLGHALDLDMMTLVNGKERTPAQFQALAERAGLHFVKIWQCRSPLQIVELRLCQEV